MSISLLWGWGPNLVVVVEVKVGTEKKVMVIIIKEFIMGIYALEPNLFELVARVSYRRVYRRELKLIATCLIIL